MVHVCSPSCVSVRPPPLPRTGPLTSPVPQLERIHWRRPAPTKAHQQQHDGAHWIQVADGIQQETPSSLAVGSPRRFARACVAELVDCDGDEQGRGNGGEEHYDDVQERAMVVEQQVY